jgi:hypothetical protein
MSRGPDQADFHLIVAAPSIHEALRRLAADRYPRIARRVAQFGLPAVRIPSA